MKKFEKYIGIALVLFAVGFNLWLYRLEPTAKIDPNDNTFQYALVDRTNQIWNFAQGKFSLLFDHWVPNWAQGYNLPAYYSHIPQIAIVATWRLFGQFTSLFTYYHWVIYLLLSLFPVSVFIALRILNMPWIAAGIGSLLASQLSTDGLYGLDPPSFLWRGYGLSSQLFAMIFLPLALAYAWKKDVRRAILFLAATTAGHLGIGMIAFLAVAVVGLRHFKKLPLIFAGVLILLGYWIVPIFLNGNYHNISFWDPIWKFNSYGTKEVLTRLFNGDLFDFGRFPVLTILVFIGFFASLLSPTYFPFALLFGAMVALYFGRATWGGLIDLIPGMREFHLSRFIVGVHLAGLFLISIAIDWLVKRVHWVVYVIIGLLFFAIAGQTIRYATFNDELIMQANRNYEAVQPDVDELFRTLRELQKERPGRVFAGRGGSWGKDFRVAETPYYMHLSTYGIPTVLWLPQTWSPNSDVEQYFSEDNSAHYDLFNIRYVVAPPSQTPQQFWKLISEAKTWKLYEVETSGYITGGIRPAIVAGSKEDYKNVVRLWIHSNIPAQGLYPELTFDTGSYPKNTGLPNFKMVNEATYQVPNGSTHALFAEPPVYQPHTSYPVTPTVLSQSDDTDMIFKATVEVPESCTECIVVLHQTYHPSWRATIDSKAIQTFAVFPFYIAIPISEGAHEVVFSYN